MTRYDYDQTLCLLLTLQQETIKKCSCYDQMLSNFDKKLSPCLSKKEIDCHDSVFEEFSKNDLTNIFYDECPLGK